MNLPHVVTVTPAGSTTVDADGNVIRSSGSSLVYPGRLYQQAALEVEGQQTTEAVRWKLILPGGSVVGPYDRVTVDGATYEVDGVPYNVAGSRTGHHVQANLRTL